MIFSGDVERKQAWGLGNKHKEGCLKLNGRFLENHCENMKVTPVEVLDMRYAEK